MRSALLYGSSESNTVFTRLKIAVQEPIVSAIIAITVEQKAGLFESKRTVDRRAVPVITFSLSAREFLLHRRRLLEIQRKRHAELRPRARDRLPVLVDGPAIDAQNPFDFENELLSLQLNAVDRHAGHVLIGTVERCCQFACSLFDM